MKISYLKLYDQPEVLELLQELPDLAASHLKNGLQIYPTFAFFEWVLIVVFLHAPLIYALRG